MIRFLEKIGETYMGVGGESNRIRAEVENLAATSLSMSPQMKQSLRQFAVSNISELRQLDAENLQEVLSCCCRALEIFEARLEQISESYDLLEHSPFLRGGDKRKIVVPKKEAASARQRLDYAFNQTMTVFNDDFLDIGSVLRVIPENYRHSVLLNMMRGYLIDGEVDSWGDCVKTLKNDMHRIQQNEKFDDMLGKFDHMIDLQHQIARNTAFTAYFSALTAWRAGR